MHIDKLEVKGFGKLKGRTVLFKKGMNIIYGSNETGKTTLQWFIKGMLYGLNSTRHQTNGLMMPQKRFEPWEGGQYGGALEYTLDDGRTYRVERNFKSGIVQLFDSYFNNITGSFDIGRDKMPLFAEQQLCLDEATFERTALIRQLEIRLDADSTAALAGRLSNVNSTGFEEISFSRAEKALSEARKKSVGTARTTTQPLDKLVVRQKQLKSEHEILQRQQEQRHSIREELLEIRNRCSRMEAEKRFLEHIGGLIEVRKALDTYLKRETGLREAVKQLNELEGVIADTEAGKERPADQLGGESSAHLMNAGTDSGKRPASRMLQWHMTPMLCTAAALFAILFGYTAVTKGILSSWLLLLVYSAGLLFAIAAGVLSFRKDRLFHTRPDSPAGNKTAWNKAGTSVAAGIAAAYSSEAPSAAGISDAAVARAAELSALVKNICSSASLLCERYFGEPFAVKQALKDVAVKLEQLSERLEQGIDTAAGMEFKPAGYFNMNDLDTLIYDSSVAWLEEAWKGEIDSVKEGILNASLKEKYYEGLLDDDQGDSDELQRVEEESVAVKEKITYLKNKGDALKLAHEVLLEAGLEIKRTFTPGLDSSMSTIITGLTAGRYMDLRGGDRLELKVTVPENGDIKSALMLSGAAADQMYLALRLAMADLLTTGRESLPLIMDEVFSQFDDNRTVLALRYLSNAYEKKQVLIFTCKKREVEISREICGDSLNLVEL